MEVEFGVIGQAAMAFATLLGAFSLIVTQFQAISAYASVMTRLGEFLEASEKAAVRNEASCIGCSTISDHFAYVDLTLRSTDPEGTVLLDRLTASFLPGTRVLVHGPNPLRGWRCSGPRPDFTRPARGVSSVRRPGNWRFCPKGHICLPAPCGICWCHPGAIAG